MSLPRRRILRPPVPPPANPHNSIQLQKLRTKLEKERQTLLRWQSRLRRSFNAVEKSWRRIHRIEKQIAQLEDSS